MLKTVLLMLITASIVVKALILEVRPQVLFPTTESLLVNCSLPHASVPRMAGLVSLILLRTAENDVTEYETLALINAITGYIRVVNEQASGSGIISNKGDSFITLSWNYPTAAMSGKYKCEAHGMDVSWRPITVVKTSMVQSVNLTVDMLADQLRTLNIQMDEKSQELKSISERFNLSAADFRDKWNRIEVSKSWFFKISKVYKGRRYFLSQQDPITKSESAMATCVMYGGYLAEIEDEDESVFVKSFIKEFSGFRLVLIGGTDEDQEEVWVYRHSNRLAGWLVKSRQAGRPRNCLFLYDENSWDAVDDFCYFDSPNYPTRFLCEIPE